MHEQEEQDYIPSLNVLKSSEEPSKESYRAFLAVLAQGRKDAPHSHNIHTQTKKTFTWFHRSFVVPGSISAFALLLLVIFTNHGSYNKQALAETITGGDADTESSLISTDTIDLSDLESIDNDQSEINEL